jgi:hypothetical protein
VGPWQASPRGFILQMERLKAQGTHFPGDREA